MSCHPLSLFKSANFNHSLQNIDLAKYLWAPLTLEETDKLPSLPYSDPYAFTSIRFVSCEHSLMLVFCRNRLFALEYSVLINRASYLHSSFSHTPRYFEEGLVDIPFIDIGCFFLPFVPILKITDLLGFISISWCLRQKPSVISRSSFRPKGEEAINKMSSA